MKEIPWSVHKREYKVCRDCKKGMGDVDLYLRGGHVYCATDYQQRFGVDPSLTQRRESYD